MIETCTYFWSAKLSIIYVLGCLRSQMIRLVRMHVFCGLFYTSVWRYLSHDYAMNLHQTQPNKTDYLQHTAYELWRPEGMLFFIHSLISGNTHVLSSSRMFYDFQAFSSNQARSSPNFCCSSLTCKTEISTKYAQISRYYKYYLWEFNSVS